MFEQNCAKVGIVGSGKSFIFHSFDEVWAFVMGFETCLSGFHVYAEQRERLEHAFRLARDRREELNIFIGRNADPHGRQYEVRFEFA